jgi:hypothetical protein
MKHQRTFGVRTLVLAVLGGVGVTAFTLPASALAAPCATATANDTWTNTAISPAQSGVFTVLFDATPSASPLNAVIGLSKGAQSAYTGFATLVRFSTTGKIDAYNGTGYAAATSVPFVAGTTYHVREVVDTTAHTYSVYVTGPSGVEQTVGLNNAFRSEQKSVSSFDSWGVNANSSNKGSLQACIGGASSSSSSSVSSASSSSSSISSSSSSASSTSSSSSSSSSSVKSSSSSSSSSVAGAFVHPGVLVNQARLDFIKQQVANGVQPFANAFQQAKSSKWGSLSYTVQGPPSGGVIDCGSYSSPNIGCSTEDDDASAAYTQALLWYITGDATYAHNAIAIMNTYAKKLTGGHTNSNGPLQSAWTAQKWPAAAEIIRYTNAGWAPADANAFATMLKTQYLPFINNNQGAGKNGNWELSMIDGMLGIAIYTEDHTLYNNAIAMWKKWVPAYVYNASEDGGKPVSFSGGPSSGSGNGWNGQSVFNAGTSGVSQETCRDMQHVALGYAAIFNAATTASLQGTDLFTPFQNRLTTAMEYYSRSLQGVTNTSQSKSFPVPSGFPGLCSGTYIPVLKGFGERAYYAYHIRMGVALPQTLQHLVNDVRPKAVPDDAHDVIWETLTHGG